MIATLKRWFYEVVAWGFIALIVLLFLGFAGLIYWLDHLRFTL